MMEGYLDLRYEPPSIKAGLPVEWVLGRLFGVWGAGNGEMIQCPLPGHMDDTASFNLWAENEDGVPMRYGCFGCGANGDVIDLIRVHQGLGFTDACTFAVDVLIPQFNQAAWQPAESNAPERQAASPEALEERLTQLNIGRTFLDAFLELKALDLPIGYVDEWQWSGAYVGLPAVVFPHRDWDGHLRGIRYRSVRRGNRWTEKGSRFDALYGAWRDQGRPLVLLCEGETDTVWAAYQLRHRGNIDVLGLASGAAQKPPPEALERLHYRTVMLAFDGDMAGRIAENRWSEVLVDAGADVRVIRMPDGEDVCSVGTGIEQLMEGAVAL